MITSSRRGRAAKAGLDGADLGLEVLELLLDGGVLLGHLLVLGLPLVALALEGLDFSLKVAGLDVSLPEPAARGGKRRRDKSAQQVRRRSKRDSRLRWTVRILERCRMSYFSLASRSVLSASSASSSSSCRRRDRVSFWVPCCWPSSAAFLKSLMAPSSFSTSASSRPFLCCRLVISCSLDRFSCSSTLTLACISSTLAAFSSDSRRSWFIFCCHHRRGQLGCALPSLSVSLLPPPLPSWAAVISRVHVQVICKAQRGDGWYRQMLSRTIGAALECWWCSGQLMRRPPSSFLVGCVQWRDVSVRSGSCGMF